MVTGPATFVVLLIIGLALVAGVLILRTEQRGPGGGGSGRECPACGHRNPAAARYCGRCGAPVQDGPV